MTEELINNESIRSQINHPDYSIETFLETNRYENLDTLINNLDDCQKILNHDLIQLVNDNFHKFIELGNLTGSQELIDGIRVKLAHYNQQLTRVIHEFDTVKHNIVEMSDFLHNLHLIKIKIRKVKVINNLIDNLQGMVDMTENEVLKRSDPTLNDDNDLNQLIMEIGNLVLLINKLIINHNLINFKKFNSLIFEFHEILNGLNGFEVHKVKRLLKDLNH